MCLKRLKKDAAFFGISFNLHCMLRPVCLKPWDNTIFIPLIAGWGQGVCVWVGEGGGGGGRHDYSTEECLE